MSYILDALKKADTERQLGTVPNIYAQPLTQNALGSEDAIWKRPLTWIYLVVAALIIFLGAFFVFHTWLDTSPARTVLQPAPVPITPPPPVPPVALAAVPAPPVVESNPDTAAAPPPIPAAEVQKPAPAEPSPPKAVPSKPKAKPARRARKEKAATIAVASKPLSAETPGLKLATEPPVELLKTTLRDLPPAIQSQIPSITVGGYIYSDNRAESQLLVNKMLLREGEQIAPGLTLERMMQHAAILNYKGYRYRISY